MKKILILLLCLCIFGCKKNDLQLTGIHTNDLHSHIFPLNNHTDCNTDDTSCLGGFARLITFMKDEKKQNPNAVFLDAGDRFTGTAYYTISKSRYLLPLFKMMPYDAATLGNHEFDDNLDDTTDFIKQWHTPIIDANIKPAKNEKLYPYIKPFIVLNKGGRKIGIIGVTTPHLNIMQGKKIAVLPIKKSVTECIEILKKQGINIIIVVSHIGLPADIKLAKALPDIDIIVGGHSHSLLINDKHNTLRREVYPLAVSSGKTLIVSSGMGGQYIGKLQATFDNAGHIIQYNGDSIPMTTNVKNDEKAMQILAEAQQTNNMILSEKITDLPRAYGYTPHKNYCSEKCAVGEYLAFLLAQENLKIDGVVINSGAIRSALPKGEITFGRILELYPYDSPAVLIELSGYELKKYLRHGITHYRKNNKTNELLQTAGIAYEFTADNKQIRFITINGKKLENKRKYILLTSRFLADGGDGFPVFPYKDSGKSIREILIRQLKNPHNCHYTPQNNVRVYKQK
ncbi:MAG: bifunctional metallophosphatase/5'-nucleotidase [Alphaproteobacteria bacterium]|nr:bifunctional metallophosphatase/5'-nucleotidase [Alphaproteobacteria bacterium]